MNWQPYYKDHNGKPEPFVRPIVAKRVSPMKGVKRIVLEELTEEFYSLVDKSGPGGCWLWLGKLTKDGYGMFHSKSASRHSYELVNGPIPKGLVLRHKCDNPPCVNPEHELTGTHADNVDDMIRRKRKASNRIPISQDVREALLAACSGRKIGSNGVTAYGEWERIGDQFSLSKNMVRLIAKGLR